jgi:hypothetical protein
VGKPLELFLEEGERSRFHQESKTRSRAADGSPPEIEWLIAPQPTGRMADGGDIFTLLEPLDERRLPASGST